MIQREVQDRLADLILAGEVRPDAVIVLDADGAGFSARVKGARATEAAGGN